MQKKILSYLIVLVIGAGIGTYFDAAHTIEEKIVTKDRIKTVIKERIVKNPDGSKVIERETTKNEKKDGSISVQESKPAKKDWGVGVKYDLFIPVPVWTIEVNRRIAGELYLSAYGRTDGVAGVGVTFFF